MPTYRAYLIDENNRVASYRPVEADGDAEALEVARQFVNGCDVEVWLFERRIGRLHHGAARDAEFSRAALGGMNLLRRL
jgi:hypothetical protein